jgi:hypothetical protein
VDRVCGAQSVSVGVPPWAPQLSVPLLFFYHKLVCRLLGCKILHMLWGRSAKGRGRLPTPNSSRGRRRLFLAPTAVSLPEILFSASQRIGGGERGHRRHCCLHFLRQSSSRSHPTGRLGAGAELQLPVSSPPPACVFRTEPKPGKAPNAHSSSWPGRRLAFLLGIPFPWRLGSMIMMHSLLPASSFFNLGLCVCVFRVDRGEHSVPSEFLTPT